jgi:hypothetical protein
VLSGVRLLDGGAGKALLRPGERAYDMSEMPSEMSELTDGERVKDRHPAGCLGAGTHPALLAGRAAALLCASLVVGALRTGGAGDAVRLAQRPCPALSPVPEEFSMSRHATAETPAPRRSARRKVVAITVVGLGIAGLGLASAAQLNLTTGSLGAGTRVVASCDTDGIAVAFTNAFNGSLKGYAVTGVTLNDVSATCSGQAISIDLLDTDPNSATAGTSLAHLTGTATATGTVTLSVSGTVAASAVQGVAVVIAG